MNKMNQDILLQRAENEFLQGNFKNALRSYGLILKDHPSLDEAKVGVYLSDLGEDNQDEAHALFDYYQVIKDEKENAVDIIDELITTLATTSHSIEHLLHDTSEEALDYAEGIRYHDFLTLAESRGDFKKTFEDIMFSTKVVISDKKEFIDFIIKLSDEGFEKMALKYLDASSQIFGNDQDVLALYHIVKGK